MSGVSIAVGIASAVPLVNGSNLADSDPSAMVVSCTGTPAAVFGIKRPKARAAGLFLAFASVLTLPHVAAGGQRLAASQYVDLIDQYQRGDDDTVARLARLDTATIEDGARGLVKIVEQMGQSGGTRLLRAAIVAHTDAAIAARGRSAAIEWTPHLAAAERYVARLALLDRDDPIARRWFVVAIGAMHAQRNYAVAISVTQRAQQVCGERVEYVLAAGITNELAWTWQHEEDFPSPFGGNLDQAEKSYERALRMDATLVEARVRLGRVRVLKGGYDAALTALDGVPASAVDALAYLAGLFAGDALERLGHPADARTRYEAAARLLPRAQSAQMALAYNAYQDGGRTEAAGRVRAFASDRPGPDDGDPWFMYLLGFGAFAQAELDKLRTLVRR